MIEAIIFDCDGTLVDSEPMHYEAWRQTLESRGFVLDWQAYFPCTGKPDLLCADFFAKKIGCKEPFVLLQEKLTRFEQIQKEKIFPIEPTVAFAKRLIQEKKRIPLKLGVASAARKSEILCNLEYLGLKNAFDLILSGADDLGHYQDETGVNKPKPYIYLESTKLLNVDPKNAVAIEDSHTGVTAAMQAGLITIAVPNQVTQFQDLSHATHTIHSFQGLEVDEFLRRASPKGA